MAQILARLEPTNVVDAATTSVPKTTPSVPKTSVPKTAPSYSHRWTIGASTPMAWAHDIVLLIMGPTGSGKSNFINKLTRRKEQRKASGLKSHTQGIDEYKLDRYGRHYVFVDTPGFDDTYRSDRDILRTIADWLEKKYRGEVKVAGIVYTHRITDNRMSGSVCKNLDLFGKMCGDKAAARVRMVTTMWDRVINVETAESRVKQLEGNFWKPLLDLEARHERFKNTSENAWYIVDELIGETEALLLQEELVEASRHLNETTAGQALYTQFQRLLYEQRETITQLAREAKAQKDPKLAEELQAEYEKVEQQLQETWKAMETMKIPWDRRIALLFSKGTRSVSIKLAFPEKDNLIHPCGLQHKVQIKFPGSDTK
ncbi:hypothetical protein ID866_9556 [Astraeus odoratus]|nr:hypothetical protein ID866_9556 [Astraeus odoratus]